MKKEIIKSINYFDDIENGISMEGFKIVTNKQTISILISSSQQCCENWGYKACSDKGIIETQDDLKDYIGAEILGIESVDTNSGEYENLLGKLDTINCTFAEFVNVKTDKGLLQFTVYNAHNGYYGHIIYIKFNNKVIYNQL